MVLLGRRCERGRVEREEDMSFCECFFITIFLMIFFIMLNPEVLEDKNIGRSPINQLFIFENHKGGII